MKGKDSSTYEIEGPWQPAIEKQISHEEFSMTNQKDLFSNLFNPTPQAQKPLEDET